MSALLTFLAQYKKIFGILGLLIVVCTITATLEPESFLKADNIENTIRWSALYGIISIGVAFVIITGGIDLSIGSVICLVGCLLAMCLQTTYQPQGLLEVNHVDPALRTLTIDRAVDQYQAGDTIAFLENIYEIQSVSGSQIVLTAPPSTGDKTGQLVRALEVSDLSAADETPIRRGTRQLHSRVLTVNGPTSGLSAGDHIELLYEVGSMQPAVIAEIQRDQGQARIRFLTRPGQRVRAPTSAVASVRSQVMPTPLAIGLVMLVAIAIGLTHGLLITKIGLQPFVVTLCGLLVYRGIARYITADQGQGFGNEYPNLKVFAKGDFLNLISGREFSFDLPMPFIYMTLIGVVAAIFLNKTIYGRYILALGRNEEAARYSGIETDRMVILSYVICAFCAGIAGILFALDLNSVQPSSHGNFYELYAIAAAVLGGCSLRGGEGSILGVVIAAAVIRVLSNAINLIDGIDTSMEFAIIGMVILAGVIVDELVKRVAARQVAAARGKD